jgi:hypothetical protein
MVLVTLPAIASAQGARLQLDNLSRLNAVASEVTDVSLDAAMLQLAASFLAPERSKEPTNPAMPFGLSGVPNRRQERENAEKLQELVSSLRGVYIKSFEFDRDKAYSNDDVQSVRKQLVGGGWTRIMASESRKGGEVGELVEIYAFREGDRSTGLAILVAEPRELTVVNIVGPIDLARLAELKGKLGIPANIPVK